MNRAVVIVAVMGLAACGRSANPPRPVVAPDTPYRGPAIVPVPQIAEAMPGPGFTVTASTVIYVETGDERAVAIGHYLSDVIGLAASGAPLSVQAASGDVPAGNIRLSSRGPGSTDEGYELTVQADGVTIEGEGAAGLFYAVQTLRQLMPAFVEYEAVRFDQSRPLVIAPARIVDQPRFPWRGAMLDVARHFMQVDEVKRFIDLIALYKINRLHLHLSDDQGWRLDITSWPNLVTTGGRTEVGGGTGGRYTQAQYRDLVAYAQARFIIIVPEIDMPGHTNAALASYAELNCDGVARPPFTGIEVGFSALCVDQDVTYKFIDDVVREIAALSPDPYFHVGGDEVKTLTPEQYARFIERVQDIVRVHGKTMIGWDETAATKLLPGSIVQHWRPKTSPQAAVARGTKVILSPADKIYLDMKYDAATAIGLTWAGRIDVRDAYDWDPATELAGVPESAVLGVEAPLWSETIANIRDVEFLAFPRIVAVAEIGWSAADRRRWDSFRERLGAQGPRWTALGVNFYRSPQVPWKH
jgi:hexosaminidase